MNKKGQTLILFVILIPIFITLIALVVDIGSMQFTYQKLKGVVDESIKEYFFKDGISSLQATMQYNDISKNLYDVTEKENEVTVHLNYEIDSIFGKLINITSYDIVVTRTGTKVNGQIVIEKGAEKWKEKQAEVYAYSLVREA